MLDVPLGSAADVDGAGVEAAGGLALAEVTSAPEMVASFLSAEEVVAAAVVA